MEIIYHTDRRGIPIPVEFIPIYNNNDDESDRCLSIIVVGEDENENQRIAS
jgi:hypothetical protein